MSREDERRDLAEAALREFLRRREAGEKLDFETFCAEQPELAGDLRALYSPHAEGSTEDYDPEKAFEGFAPASPDISQGNGTQSARSDQALAFPGLQPQRVGPYRILQTLGEGGFGVVYLAEQETPVRRRVALKVIKLGMDTKAVVARFEAERQALAMMDHPNVARILDAGATEQGRPYFVMERVEGIPITEYCDRHRLNHRERLGLFLQVCEAIQHAHQKGIIHRDIKPSNILVSVKGDTPFPKVIDFGVAKAISQRLTEKTVYTERGQLIGTPEYMSPEQAEMSDLNIDTRSDVYSLGVLLHELLVGRLPFDPRSLRQAGLAEIHRIIREVEPPRPSTRASELGEDAAEIARRRQTDPASLVRQIRGDLDWIIMKTLEKDRTRRYATVSELAADIQRHRHDEPVMASPPSVRYRMGKFIKKHRGPVLGAAAVLVTLVLGVVVSLLLYFEADRARKEVLRLSDVKRLADSIAQADDLWPCVPEKATDMETWLAEARELARHLEGHRMTLAALRERAVPREGHPKAGRLADLQDEKRDLKEDIDKESLEKLEQEIASLEERISQYRTWTFSDTETQWQHDVLAELVADLERFRDPEKGLMADVEKRLEFARTIFKRSIEDHRDGWNRAIASISNEKECPQYKGLEITHQLGLVPLGPDRDSGLWEFAHLETGEIPERDENGKLNLTEKTGLVFVLIPGGTFKMGAERPSLGIRAVTADGELRIEEILEGSLAERLGLRPGDVVVAGNYEEIKNDEDLAKVFRGLRSGGEVTVGVKRGGERMTFTGNLGSNIDPQADNDEGPVHEVTLEPFFISKYEMTQGQWRRFTGGTPSVYAPDRIFLGRHHSLLHPVETVSWDDCDQVLKRLALVLPTEAQWEYACRAGTTSVWWTGDDRESLRGKVNIADGTAARAGVPWESTKNWPDLDDGYAVHAPAGTYAANRFGLHEVHGNVWEWCRDWYGGYSLPVSPGDGERQVLEGVRGRVVRGGNFRGTARIVRSAYRGTNAPSLRGDNLGVRPARVMTE